MTDELHDLERGVDGYLGQQLAAVLRSQDRQTAAIEGLRVDVAALTVTTATAAARAENYVVKADFVTTERSATRAHVRLDDHADRLKAVESSAALLRGALLVLSLALPLGTSLAVKWVTG